VISEPRTGNRDQARGHRANHPSDEDLSLGTPGADGVLLSLVRRRLAGMSGVDFGTRWNIDVPWKSGLA
jgi:hypothetical protein